MKKIILTSLLSLFASQGILADEPYYDNHWEWNRNVKISFIYGFENNGALQVKLNNGQFCYIPPKDKELISLVVAMRAQQSVGQVVCRKNSDKSIDGMDSRRMHRLMY